MSLLISEQPLLIMPKLAAKIGLNEAILAQQIHYWVEKSDKFYDGKHWIYNTHDSWLEQFPFWSKATLKRVIISLKSQGIIFTGNYNKMKMDRTVWYTINYSHPVCLGITKSNQVSPIINDSQQDQPLDQIEPKVVSHCSDVDANLTLSHKVIMTSPIPETTEITTENTLDIDFGCLSESEFNELAEIRIANHEAQKKKAPEMTQRIANELTSQISLAVKHGFTVDDVLNKFATRSWLSFQFEWIAPKKFNKTGGGQYAVNKPVNNSAPSKVRAINAEREANRSRPERAIN